jgi:glycerate dehydrogenase
MNIMRIFKFLLPITSVYAESPIIGLGNIGQKVAQLAQAFGMKVLATTRTPKNMAGVEMVELADIWKRSDFISLHCPLTDSTKDLVCQANLQKMKSTAIIINTGRGPLVNEADLAEALNAKLIAGAACDVLSSEPPKADNPLLKAKNCVITPHIAWATVEARTRLLAVASENVKQFLAGCPQNVVK